MSCEKRLEQSNLELKENASIDRFKLSYKIFCMTSSYSFKPQLSWFLSRNQMAALESLSSLKSLIITKPDKGNGVVLMDRDDYICKINEILCDTTKVCPLNADFKCLLSKENKWIAIFRKMSKTKSISDSTSKFPILMKLWDKRPLD